MPTNEFYAGQKDYIPKLNGLWDRATVSVIGTSIDSLSVTTGSKSFTTNTNLQFAAGSQVTLTATSDLSKYMSGQVTAYNQSTGAITINVTSTVGSGTFSSWSLTLSGAAGATGADGADGIADNISIGTVTSGVAAASITGTSPNKFLNLTLQTGATGATGAAGAPNVLSIGTVTSSGAADATITGTSPSQVLNLVLPKGDTGATGATGAKGVNPRGNWNAGTAYIVDDLAYYSGSTWRRIIAGTTATAPSSDATNWEIFAQKGADGAGSVAGVTASAPLASTGGANPDISITQANTSTNGYLSSTDWNTFNGKAPAAGSASVTTLGTVTTGTWNAGVVAGQYGGTGVNNNGKTITLGGNLTTAGAFASTFTMTANTNVTLPSSGTLITLAGAEVLTNKTLTAPVINNPTGITKTNVGLGNVDNTADVNKPISTDTQTALNTKQDTLVSATNIKTINGISVLGTGDIIINAIGMTRGRANFIGANS